ncbi:MAG: D-aminoacyl-tRNA deacylase [Ornithinimicrobium sp.]
MRAVLQRVHRASVSVEGSLVGEIGWGVLALVAATHTDGEEDVATMARKIAELRMLADDTSIQDTVNHGAASRREPAPDGAAAPPAVLVVSQFTLYGTTKKGRRPSWSAAAPGDIAEPLVDAVAQALRDRGISVATGIFGAQMDVCLVNDGPFTLIVDTSSARA